MGLFHPFLDDPSVAMIGVEAGGHGIETGLHAASLNGGVPGVLHGNRTYLLQDDDGQIKDAHSISAGLDYPGIGPEHSWLNDLGRVAYVAITDAEALDAFQLCARMEGIIPALEPAHALAHVAKIAPGLPKDHLLVMNMCGRGDKDIFAGADLIEIGMPFSDPMADGPAIQAAGLRALKAGMSLAGTLALVRRFRAEDEATPLVLMGYYNPIYRYGVARFLADAKSSGVDGLIIVDLPPEHDDELCLPAQKAG